MTDAAPFIRRSRARRATGIFGAFMRLGFLTAWAYPLSFWMGYLGTLLPAFIYFFVAKLVPESGPTVGGDYYTFVIVGLMGVQVLDAGLRALNVEVSTAINRGWFEMLLVEPVRWRLLPFGLVQWPTARTLVAVTLLFLVSIPLGADLNYAGIPAAMLIILLGLAASLVIGTVSTGFKVLAKSGDPLLTLYLLAAQVLSGAVFPIDLLPSWLQWVSWLLPHTYVIASLRRVLMPNGADLPGPELGTTVLVLTLFCVVFMPLALYLFGRAMEYGRKMGVLSGY